MTIEKSPAPTASHKAAASTGGHAARAKASAADAAPDAGAAGTGFLAILGAMEAMDAPGDGATETALPDASASAAPPVDLTASLAANAPVPVPAAAPFDVSTLLQQNPQIAAALAAQATAAAAPALDAAVPAQILSASTGVQAPSFTPPAAAAPLANAAAAPAPKWVGATRPASAGQAAAASAVGAPATDAPDLAASATQGLQHAFARANAGRQSLLAEADTSPVTSGAATGAGERAESSRFLAALERATEPVGARVAEPVLAPLLVKQEKPQAERSGLSDKKGDPTYSGTTLGVGLPEASQAGAATPVLAPEMQVAEQVSYWVSHHVQNAELTLDGLGQSPVQVSISLQGNEAQISFRTDEAAAREVLQNAAAHLKDLLQSEGLVLTGVSVGSSGSGNADGSERRARPDNARQTAFAPLQAASVEGGSRLRTASAGTAGRSVDLFV